MNRSSMSKQMDNLPNKKDNARQAKLDKDSSPEGARKAGKKKFFEMYEDDGRTPKNKEKEMKGMKKMNMGGMATANKYDRNTKERREEADMQSGRLKFEKAPSGPLKMKKGGKVKPVKKMNMGGMTSPSGMDAAAMMAMKKKKRKPMMPAQQAMDGGAAMPMMKKGGKVRGAGMAKKGVRACKMR